MVILLALDPATVTGYAFTTNGLTDATTGKWRAKGVRGEPHRLAAAHARNLTNLLNEIGDPDYALIEKPASKALHSIGTQNALWSLHGAISGVLTLRGIPYRTIQPNAWRAAVLEKGSQTANKAKDRACALAAYHGHRGLSDDRAEAYCLLVHLYQHYRRWVLEDRLAA